MSHRKRGTGRLGHLLRLPEPSGGCRVLVGWEILRLQTGGVRRDLGERRDDAARTDAVDPDVLVRVLEGHHLRQLNDPGLGGAVGRHAGQPDEAGRRSSVDDDTAALLKHHLNGVFGAEEGPCQVRGEDAVPDIFSQIGVMMNLPWILRC